MSGRERRLLYTTAIQTGLRSNEMRSLTRGSLFLDASQPFVLCRAGSAKNRQQARQLIDDELANELRAHIATKAPKAAVFAMPYKNDLVNMLREDLAEARRVWVREAIDDPAEYAAREKSDFLAATNHEGEVFDFHGFRHSYGTWLALAGVPVKVVQTIMRHSTITLTMDTYGHLFPGQEADAATRMSAMLRPDQPRSQLATGTNDASAAILPFDAQRQAQRARRDSLPGSATPNDASNPTSAQEKTRNVNQRAGLCDSVRQHAAEFSSSGDGTRTRDSRIMNPVL